MNPAPTPEVPRESITAYLSWDHDRLDAILIEVRRMVDDGELERADHTYAEFHAGLSRHIGIEEKLLFPMFEERTGMTGGPTQVMRHEHRMIEAALDGMRRALEAGNGPGFVSAHEALLAVLPGHNEKEERILYPMTDRSLSAEERAACVDQYLRV